MQTRLRIAKLAPSDTAHVEKTLEALPAVTSAHVESPGSVAMVEHDGTAGDEMIAAMRHLGYVAEIERGA
jgi:copper chaperone CopZ